MADIDHPLSDNRVLISDYPHKININFIPVSHYHTFLLVIHIWHLPGHKIVKYSASFHHGLVYNIKLTASSNKKNICKELTAFQSVAKYLVLHSSKFQQGSTIFKICISTFWSHFTIFSCPSSSKYRMKLLLTSKATYSEAGEVLIRLNMLHPSL